MFLVLSSTSEKSEKFFQKLQNIICLRKWENGIFVHTICFGSFFNVLAQPWKHFQIVVSGDSAKARNDTFSWESLFWDGWKLLIVFFKSCALLKTLFYSVFSKHSSCSKNGVCWKTENLWEIVLCSSTWQKGVFSLGVFVTCLVCGGWLCGVCLFFFVFWGFIVLWFVFLSVLYSCKCVEMHYSQLLCCLGCSVIPLFGFGRFKCKAGPWGPAHLTLHFLCLFVCFCIFFFFLVAWLPLFCFWCLLECVCVVVFIS